MIKNKINVLGLKNVKVIKSDYCFKIIFTHNQEKYNSYIFVDDVFEYYIKYGYILDKHFIYDKICRYGLDSCVL